MLRKISSKLTGKGFPMPAMPPALKPNNIRSMIRNTWSKVKNPKSESGFMLKRIAIGLGICAISIGASLLGLRG
jgi:hypothetical protein